MRTRVCTVVLMILWGGAWTAGAAAQSATTPTPPPSTDAPSMPATPAAEAVTTGVAAKVRFGVSHSPQGMFVQLVPSLGYDFRKWGLAFAVPIDSVGASSTAASATSHAGPGDASLTVYYTILSNPVTFTSTVGGTAPSGNATTGLGTGQATWDWTNHIDHGVDRLTPFLDVGVGNGLNTGISATSVTTRVGGRAGRTATTTAPYSTVGKVAHGDAGTEVDVWGPVSLSVSAYNTVPWGNQTVISHFVTQTKSSTPSTTMGQRPFEVNAITRGTASLTRDDGFGASIDISPTPSFDLTVGFGRSVAMNLNTWSVSAGTNLTKLFGRASDR